MASLRSLALLFGLLLLGAVAPSVQAQTIQVDAGGGFYLLGGENDAVGPGFGFRADVPINDRYVPATDLSFGFEANATFVDWNLLFKYRIPVGSGSTVLYPLAGLNVLGTYTEFVDDNSAGFNLGAGALLGFGDRWNGYVELRGRFGDFLYAATSAGVMYRFYVK